MFLPRSAVFALALLSAPLSVTAPLAANPVVVSTEATTVVNAMPLAPFDVARPVFPRVMDDSAANLAILDSLKAALSARGVTLAEDRSVDGVLLLDVETIASQAVARPDPSRVPIGLSGQAGTSDDEDSVDVKLRIYSNVQGSVLGGDRDAPKPSLGGPALRLDLGLTDPETGRRVWQGWGTVSAPALGLEGQGVLLTAPLAEAYGQSVIGKTETLSLGRQTRP